MSEITPSHDPAEDDSMVGAFRLVLEKFLQNVDDMLPARVVAVNGNRNKPRVTVQPLVRVVTTGDTLVSRAQIAALPVLQLGGGGCMLSFPLKVGDLGWVKANDRDISLFLQNCKESPPNTFRKHTFQDGVFIPDAMRDYVIAGEDALNATLQTLDGATKVTVGPAGARLVSGGSSVSVTPTGVTITGTLTINGVPYLTHKHTGVMQGVNNTGNVTA